MVTPLKGTGFEPLGRDATRSKVRVSIKLVPCFHLVIATEDTILPYHPNYNIAFRATKNLSQRVSVDSSNFLPQ
jgi:hypothetical protein